MSKLTEGSIRGHVLDLALPMSFGLLSLMSKNLVDTYFVGQLGTEDLSAIGFTFPIILLMMSVSIGLGAGTSSVVARVLGTGDFALARRRATDALVLAFIIVGTTSSLGVLLCRPVFAALGAEGVILDKVVAYMMPWFLGFVTLVMPMVGNSLLRAAGEGRLPGLIMFGSAVLNAVADPFLIFGWWGVPALGIAGASMATVLSNFVASLFALALIVRRDLLCLNVPRATEVWASWKDVLRIAVPAAATNTINPLGLTAVTAMLASVGASAVAAFGVASRIENLSCILLLSLSAAIGPVVGQNQGAGRSDRVQESLSVAFQLCWLSGVTAATLLLFAAPSLTPFFDDSSEVQALANLYLSIVPLTFAGYGMNIVVAAAFNALGRPLAASSMTVTRMFGVYLPVAWLLATVGELGAVGVFVGAAAGNVVGGTIAWFAARSLGRRPLAFHPTPAS
jgi:putative MATE family efflux protein